VTDSHRALIPTCRHSVNVRSAWMTSQLVQNDCLSLSDCLGFVLVPQMLVAPYAQFCGQFDDTFDKLCGIYLRHFVTRLI